MLARNFHVSNLTPSGHHNPDYTVLVKTKTETYEVKADGKSMAMERGNGRRNLGAISIVVPRSRTVMQTVADQHH